MATERALSEAIALHWLDSTRTIPTRALQLAFERAHERFHQLTDFSIILAILKNNPSVVSSDLVAQITSLSQFIESKKSRVVAIRNSKGRTQYSQTLDPVRVVLSQYLMEKQQGLHPYTHAQDCSTDLLNGWLDEIRIGKRPSGTPPTEQDVVALGHADYLRLAARAIEHIPGRIWRSGSSFNASSLSASLKGQPAFDQKAVSKLFKKLSQKSRFSEAQGPEHQDVVLMLSGGTIRVRPASFIQEAKWQVSTAGISVFGSVHNLLERDSPVHSGNDPILEFEELLNNSFAAEGDFQEFFERYPKFLLGTDYSRLVSQPVLVRDDENDLIPDFILVPHSFARPTILDLKLPSASLARHKKNREGFLQAAMEARDQLLEYRNYFSRRSTAIQARGEFGCDLYLPRIAVVIGRSSSFIDDFERRKIESRVPDIDVITYDDIYQRALQCRDIGLL